jgi:hypothetical protein
MHNFMQGGGGTPGDPLGRIGLTSFVKRMLSC